MVDKDALILPMEVQFAPEDQETLGDQWYTYDELAIVTLPAPKLIELEAEMGATVVSVLQGFRQDSTFGSLTASWLAVKMAGMDIPFRDFRPLVLLAKWRQAEAPGKPGPSPTSPDSPEQLSIDTAINTVHPDTVVLSTMPVSESVT